MAKGSVEINGKEYVVGPGGVFVDLDGNVCGFLGGDIVRECQLEEEGENFVDTLVGTLTKKEEEEGAKGLRRGIGRRGMAFTPLQYLAMAETTVVAGLVATAIHEGREAEKAYERQVEAEYRAKEMERRVQEARERHRKKRG